MFGQGRGGRTRLFSLTFVVLMSTAIFGAPTGAAPASRGEARVSLRARNEPVQEVLLRLARESGASISVGPGVSGYVTASLHAVTLPQALAAILAPLGDTFHVRGGVYDVEPGTGTPSAAGMSPSVLPVTVVPVQRAAAQIRALFPQASVREDARSNALLVVAPPADVQAMRTVLQGIDVRNPTTPVTEALGTRSVRADAIVAQLRGSFPAARITAVGPRQLLVTALPPDLAQIRTALSALDAPAVTPPPVALGSDAVRVTQRRPSDVARALARQVAGLRASVSGSTVILVGPPEAVARAKALVAQLDVPAFDARYTQNYRIRSLDAGSVAALLRRSFRAVEVTVDAAINALAVTATAAEHQRIADAVAQLDPAPGSPAVPARASPRRARPPSWSPWKSAVPGQSANAPDATAAITQALQLVAPDVKVIPLTTPGQLALVGPPPSLRTAREFIEKVDVVAPQVVLDTEVLELDENSGARNLGLQLGSTVDQHDLFRRARRPPTRTARFRASAVSSLRAHAALVPARSSTSRCSSGRGRVLADPRITTLSGRTATIRRRRHALDPHHHRRQRGHHRDDASAELPDRRHARHHAAGRRAGRHHRRAAPGRQQPARPERGRRAGDQHARHPDHRALARQRDARDRRPDPRERDAHEHQDPAPGRRPAGRARVP